MASFSHNNKNNSCRTLSTIMMIGIHYNLFLCFLLLLIDNFPVVSAFMVTQQKGSGSGSDSRSRLWMTVSFEEATAQQISSSSGSSSSSSSSNNGRSYHHPHDMMGGIGVDIDNNNHNNHQNENNDNTIISVFRTIQPFDDQSQGSSSSSSSSSRSSSNKHGKQFDTMFQEFCHYTEYDIYSVQDYRMRTILDGVAASSREPEVYKSFQILYEDLFPIRIAGRLLFKTLKRVIDNSIQQRNVESKNIMKHTIALDKQIIEQYRLLYCKAVIALSSSSPSPANNDEQSHQHQNQDYNNHHQTNNNKDDFTLSVLQLEQLGFLNAVNDILQFDNTNEVLSRIVNNNDYDTGKATKSFGDITFEDLIIGLQCCINDSTCTTTTDTMVVTDLLQLLINKMKQKVIEAEKVTLNHHHQYTTTTNHNNNNNHEIIIPQNNHDNNNLPRNKNNNNKKYEEYCEKYDQMVESFKEWKQLLPEKSTGRRIDIIRGCFVGAENKRVVNALKIVYVDYSALRVAGNAIFALVRSAINKKQNNKIRNSH